MTESVSDPKGGVAPVSKRVMNLSHFVRQAARRYGQEIGLVWGDATWTWAEIDRRGGAMAAAPPAGGGTKRGPGPLSAPKSKQIMGVKFRFFPPGPVCGAAPIFSA